jgi:hypothetical protein
MKLKIVVLISLTTIIFCASNKEIKNIDPTCDLITEEDPRIIKADLSNEIEAMNDTNKIFKKSDPHKNNRSRSSMQQFICNNLNDLRYEYNKALKMDSTLNGTVTVQMRIIQDGRIDTCSICKTKITDTIFLNSILKRIKKWQFGVIEKPIDTTVCTYPFVFTP